METPAKIRLNGYTQEQLRSEYLYDKDTGAIYRQHAGVPWLRVDKGNSQAGYKRVTLGGKTTPAARFAWFYETGELPPIVDHKDGVPGNNKWVNLRAATQRDNAINKLSTSGAKALGVTLRRDGFYVAQITSNGKAMYLGSFIKKDDAIKARLQAVLKYHGEFSPQYEAALAICKEP